VSFPRGFARENPRWRHVLNFNPYRLGEPCFPIRGLVMLFLKDLTFPNKPIQRLVAKCQVVCQLINTIQRRLNRRLNRLDRCNGRLRFA